jgi:hypothetical protein
VEGVTPHHIDPGALLARTWRLEDGFTVRLRVARRGDGPAVRALLDRCDVEATDLEVSRLVRPDPRREITLCAAAPVDRHEEIVGIGSIAYDEHDAPRTVVCDERMRGGGARLLDAALRELVRRRARRVA